MTTLSILVAGAALAAKRVGSGASALGAFREFGDLVDAVEVGVARGSVGLGFASFNGVIALDGGVGVFGSARHGVYLN